MTVLAALFWITEFLLEVKGYGRARTRSLSTFTTFLGFRVFADLVCAALVIFAGPFFYAWAWYAQALIQYVLFTVLVMFLCAKLLGSDRYTMRFYSASAGVLMLLAIAFFHARTFSMANVLHFAAGTYMLMGMCLCLALATMRCADWMWLGIGALILSASNGLLSALHAAGMNVTAFYPLGEILALGVWYCALGAKPGINEVRLSLQPRVLAKTLWLDESAKMEC